MNTTHDIPKRRLHFDIEGNRIWDSADMHAGHFREVLDDWNAVVSWQLAADAERRLLPADGPILSYAGIPRKFSRLNVLDLLLEDIKTSLPAKAYFADRLSGLPPRPEEPARPALPESRAPGSMREAMERARYEKDSKAYQTAHNEWSRREREWQEARPDNERRVRKMGEYKEYLETREKLMAALATLESWKEIVRTAASLPGEWKFLPPGPWLDYRESWLREWFTRHYPGVDFDFKRLAIVNGFKPMAMVHGSIGETEGYTAYLFKNGKAVLESPRVGHALYFFHRDWAVLCLRQKSELIHMMEHGKEDRVERFVHNRDADLAGWLQKRLDLAGWK